MFKDNYFKSNLYKSAVGTAFYCCIITMFVQKRYFKVVLEIQVLGITMIKYINYNIIIQVGNLKRFYNFLNIQLDLYHNGTKNKTLFFFKFVKSL